MGHKVVAPMVGLKIKDPITGAVLIRNYYAGAPVPKETTEESLQHHIDSGLVVEEGTLAADYVAVPAGTPVPGEPPNVLVTEQTPMPRAVPERVDAAVKATEKALGKTDAPAKADRKPATSASKDDWRAYAVTVEQSKGKAEPEARAAVEPLTRDELVKRYG